MATRKAGAVPVAFLAGDFTFVLLALWIAFSCSRWFGVTGVQGLPDVTIERICFGLLVVYAATTFAMQRQPLGGVLPAEIGLMGFTVACAVSGYLHGTLQGTEADPMNTFYYSRLYPAIAFMIVVRSRTTNRDLLRLSAILTVFAIYLGVTALIEKSPFTWALIPRAIGDPGQGIHFGRARGPFLNSAFNGTVMVQLLPVVLLSSELGSRARQRVALITAGLLCVGVYLTDTRAVLLSLVAVVAVGAVLMGPSRRTYRGILGFLMLGAIARYAVGGAVVPRLEQEDPINVRMNLLLATGEIVLAHPITGSGYRTFALVDEEYYNRAQAFGNLSYQEKWFSAGSHNTLLTPLAEMGLLAGGFYLFLLCRAVANGLRAPLGGTPGERDGTRGLLVCSLLVGIPFLINGLAVELQYTLTPNALFWAFAAFSERHLQLRKVAAASLSPTASVRPDVARSGLIAAQRHYR
jgi:O-antigen ligase